MPTTQDGSLPPEALRRLHFQQIGASTIAVGRAEPHILPMTLVDQVLDGRYRIVRKVGEGGMSSVYLANDTATTDRYAIKVFSARLSSDQNAMRRLEREVSLAMQLAHPNLCHVIRMGETQDGLVYVVTRFVEGETLSDRTIRKGVLPVGEVAKHVTDIAAGLHAAHELNIVHRDVKPENILICKSEDGTERAVVMDLGLATSVFMSPEQLLARPLDRRTDVYSLAVTAYEMLTGRLPFTGRTTQEMMIARLRNEPMPLREARPDLDYPEALERVLAKAMQRAPEDRYATAPEFANALAAAISATPENPGGFGR